MKGRGRFIRGAFRRPLADDKNERPPEAERVPSAPEPHDPANDVIDDVPIPYPPLAKARASKLSHNARDLLAGREVMLSDSFSDDVSSINDSVYQEAVNRPTNTSLLVGGPEAFQRAASKREEILLLSDAESFGRHAPTRVKSLYAAKSADGSTAEKPIKLLGSQSEDEEDSLESGLSLSSNVLKEKLNEFKSKYQMADLEKSSNHPEEVLSNSSKGNSHGKEKAGGPLTYAGIPNGYPRWLRLAIIATVASLVGAIVLVALAVSNTSSSDNAGTTTTESTTPGNSGTLEFGTAENGDNSDVQSVPTLMQPTPADVNSPAPVPTPSGFVLPPVNQPTMNSIFALITRAPTANPALSTNPPTTSPTGATVSVLTTEPPSEPTSAPPVPTPSELPTGVASNEPTFVHSSTPTIVPTTRSPTASPTIDTVNKMVIYLTAGHIDESVDLRRFPKRKKTSFLVHLGDWNEEEKCKEEDYQGVTQNFANSSVPVYFVMGDDGKQLVI